MRRVYKNFDSPHLILRKRLRFNKLAFVLVLVLILMCSAIASWFLLISPNFIRLGKHEFYILTLDKSESLSEAQELSNAVSDAGGSGYLISDGEFKVCAAAYTSLSDANSVYNRLLPDFPNSSVVTLTTNRKWLKSVDKAIDSSIKSAINYVPQLIDTILHENLSLDSQQKTESALLHDLEGYNAEIDGRLHTAESIYAAYPNSKTARMVHSFYKDLSECYSEATSLTDTTPVSVKLKRITCMLAYKYYVLRTSL